MNRQLILLTIALVAFVCGSPHHNKNAYGYQSGNIGGGYGTGGHHEQHSTANAFNSESEYQQGQYGSHLNSGSGHLGSGSGHLSSGSGFMGSSNGYTGSGIGHMGSNGGHLSGGNGELGNNFNGFSHGVHHGHGVLGQGGFGQGGFGQGGFGQGGLNQGGLNQGGLSQGGLSQGGLSQGGFGQGGFGQGGFGQSGLNQGGLGQAGLNHGSLQHQQNFRSGGEIDGSSISIATDFPKEKDEAIVFGNQPISGDWSSIQSQAGISEVGLSGGLRDEASLLTPTTWGAVTNRSYRKIPSSAILPISYSNEQESKNVSKQQTSPNGSTTDGELRS